jgi:hypothetical protein
MFVDPFKPQELPDLGIPTENGCRRSSTLSSRMCHEYPSSATSTIHALIPCLAPELCNGANLIFLKSNAIHLLSSTATSDLV